MPNSKIDPSITWLDVYLIVQFSWNLHDLFETNYFRKQLLREKCYEDYYWYWLLKRYEHFETDENVYSSQKTQSVPLQKVDFNENHSQWLNINSFSSTRLFLKPNIMLGKDSLNTENIKIASDLQLCLKRDFDTCLFYRTARVAPSVFNSLQNTNEMAGFYMKRNTKLK